MRTYLFASGAIFTLVALVHIVRLIEGWTVTVGPFAAPMWVSWLGIILARVLAVWAFTLAVRGSKH